MQKGRKKESGSLNKGWTWASQYGLYDTSNWRKLRNLVLEDEPFCRICRTMKKYTPAVMVDHIIPITEKNWTELFLDINNLQPLCDECHKFKTQRDKIKPKNILSMDEILDL